jgi:Protein of unknown function (DUF3313)
MRTILITALVLVVLGAAPPVMAQEQSQFLDTYPPLQADAQRPNAKIYVAPGKTLKGYDKVAIYPILVWYSPSSKYQGVDPNELAKVTENLREAVAKNLQPQYAIADSEGEHTLQVRLAITNVVAQKKKKGLLGYTPMGLVVGAAKSAATAGPNIDLASATIETELLDDSGGQLAVIVEPMQAGKSKDEKLTWNSIADAFDAYGKRLRARLDADNAK